VPNVLFAKPEDARWSLSSADGRELDEYQNSMREVKRRMLRRN